MKIRLRKSLKSALIVLVVLSFIPLAVIGVMRNVNTSQWLLQQVFSLFSEQMTVTASRGRLWDGLEIEDFKFHNDTQNIQLKHALIRWKLEGLSNGLLKINQIKLDDLTVVAKKDDKKSDFDPLAKIDLPLDIVLDDFSLSNLKFTQEQQTVQLDTVHFSAKTEQNQLFLSALKLQGQGAIVTANGKTRLGEGFPFSLAIVWQYQHPEQGKFRGTVSAKGDISAVSFDNQLLAPFGFQQQGNVSSLMQEPQITTHGQWQNLRYPLTGSMVQIASKDGGFKFSGTAKKYALQLNAQLKQTEALQAVLQINGTGTDEDFHIAPLKVQSKIGQLQLSGDVGWKNNLHFALLASGEHFNPALFVPDAPGDLNFKTDLKGQILNEKLQLAVNLENLTGKLRNYPVLAQGCVDLNDKDLAIKTFSLISGANKVAVHGTLGQENAALDVVIAAPQLQSLWKGLGGKLNATAHLQGELTHPSVQLKADGQNIHFQQHAVKNLAMSINYAADDKKASALQITAAGIRSGVNNIEKFILTGQGTKPQHRFTAQVNSEQGDVSLALSGGWQNNHWLARLSDLNVSQPQAGRWQLKNPVALNVAKLSKGVDVSLGESCFTQAAAIVCAQGSYPANGNFQGAFHVSLPDALTQKYLPAKVKFSGQVNASGEVKKNTAGMNGRYQLSLSKNSRVSMMIDKQQTTIPLNEVSLVGTMQGTQVDNTVNLVFAEKNYLRGSLRLDTGSSQAMSGQLSVGMMDFALIKPFITQISNLKGTVTANVDIAGTLKKPAVTGSVALNNTSFTVDQAGIALQEIELKLVTLASNPENLIITGRAKSGAGHLNINGKANLNPDSGYPAEVDISGIQFEVAKLPTAQVVISPDLHYQYGRNINALTGKVTIAKARIQMEEVPANAVAPSEDEEIVGEAKTVVEKAVPAPPMAVDIAIDLGKQTHFSGLGLNTDLSGTLKLTQKNDNLAMFGTVDMQKARYKSYGQDLTVRRGRFVFNGSTSNPILDVEAIRLSKSQKVTVILKVTGAVNSPQTQISSEPSLPESDALAYLVTGRPLSQLTKSDGNMLASAALSYGAGKIAWIAEKFGIDEMELQEGESMKDSLMAVGQYLTPNFYVGAKVGLFNKQTILTLKYKITEGLNISTQVGDSQRAYINYEFSHE